MLKQMIPPPHFPHNTPDDQKHELHKQHVRQTVHQHQNIGFDRKWVRKYFGWAGHLSRLPANRWAKHSTKETSIGGVTSKNSLKATDIPNDGGTYPAGKT